MAKIWDDEIIHKTEITRQSDIFAKKAARSMIELQVPLVINTVADVMLFLEIQGYNDNIAKENGFENLYSLAKYIYNFIDIYSKKNFNREAHIKSLLAPIPSLIRRIPKALVLMLTWVGSLLLLLLIGTSLWMMGFRSEDVTTMLQLGAFLGLVATEGPWQAFNMLFSLYYSQENISGIKHLLKKIYVINGAIIAGTVIGIVIFGIMIKLPQSTLMISAFMCTVIALHKTSIMIMYALRKVNQLMIAYAIGLLAVFLMFYAFADIIPNYIVRYIIALTAALGVPAAFTIYYHYKLLWYKPRNSKAQNSPSFYIQPSASIMTIKPRFSIHMWEAMRILILGLFSFIMIFEDRLISWIYNPIYTNTRILPFSYNPIYHMGADMSLIILLVVGLVQYIILLSLYEMVYNKSLMLSITQLNRINKFLIQRYKLTMVTSVILSVALSIILYRVGPSIIDLLGGTQTSVFVLHYSCIANSILSIFIVNSQFMVLCGKIKHLAILVVAAAVVNGAIGFKFAPMGFENAVFGYLFAAIMLASISTVYILRNKNSLASMMFARFI
jgi:hypothetical protein